MKLMATMILAICVLFECGPKQYSRFTVTRPVKLAGQMLDPQGAAVPNLKLVVKCGSSKYARVTDGEGKYDFGVLPAGSCEIGTTEQIWKPPEVTRDADGCAIQKLRLAPMSVTVT
jgi:hypothetical protein